MHRSPAPTKSSSRFFGLILLALLPLLVLVWLQALATGRPAPMLAALLASCAGLLLAMLAARAGGRLQSTILQAQAESRARDEALTRLGHELRNPVAAISAAVDVLQTAPADSDTAAQARSIIARQVRTLSDRINAMLRAGGPPTGARAAEPPPPRRGRQVLLVEDNEDVRAALRAQLERDGHTVSTASGAEGLARLLQLRPEVSVVDVGQPGSAGFRLARDARAAGYAGRLIALSADGHEGDAAATRVAGFDAHLVMPVDQRQLNASVHGA